MLTILLRTSKTKLLSLSMSENIEWMVHVAYSIMENLLLFWLNSAMDVIEDFHTFTVCILMIAFQSVKQTTKVVENMMINCFWKGSCLYFLNALSIPNLYGSNIIVCLFSYEPFAIKTRISFFVDHKITPFCQMIAFEVFELIILFFVPIFYIKWFVWPGNYFLAIVELFSFIRLFLVPYFTKI